MLKDVEKVENVFENIKDNKVSADRGMNLLDINSNPYVNSKNNIKLELNKRDEEIVNKWFTCDNFGLRDMNLIGMTEKKLDLVIIKNIIWNLKIGKYNFSKFWKDVKKVSA